MSESEKLGLLLEIQSHNKVERDVDNFVDKLYSQYKEFEEVEIPEETYTIDNLLEVVSQLNKRLENLTNDYNCLIEDCESMLYDCLSLLPEQEVI